VSQSTKHKMDVQWGGMARIYTMVDELAGEVCMIRVQEQGRGRSI
jgi:hypothetical protein